MNPLALIYGAMTLVALGLSIRGHDARSRDASRPTFALLIAVSWAATEMSRIVGSLDAWPAMDAVLACLVAKSHYDRRASWKTILLMTYVAQACGHAAFAIVDDGSREVFRTYASANNAIFVLQLVIVAQDGGRKAYDDVRDWLSSRMRRGGDIRPGAFCKDAEREEGIGDDQNVAA